MTYEQEINILEKALDKVVFYFEKEEESEE